MTSGFGTAEKKGFLSFRGELGDEPGPGAYT